MAVSENEKDRDNWVRITLRLPPEVHAKIVASSGLNSMNSTIVELVETGLRMKEIAQVTELLDREEINYRASEDVFGRLRSKALDQILEKVQTTVRDELALGLKQLAERIEGKKRPGAD